MKCSGSRFVYITSRTRRTFDNKQQLQQRLDKGTFELTPETERLQEIHATFGIDKATAQTSGSVNSLTKRQANTARGRRLCLFFRAPATDSHANLLRSLKDGNSLTEILSLFQSGTTIIHVTPDGHRHVSWTRGVDPSKQEELSLCHHFF